LTAGAKTGGVNIGVGKCKSKICALDHIGITATKKSFFSKLERRKHDGAKIALSLEGKS
jgi:hypothetical protein